MSTRHLLHVIVTTATSHAPLLVTSSGLNPVSVLVGSVALVVVDVPNTSLVFLSLHGSHPNPHASARYHS